MGPAGCRSRRAALLEVNGLRSMLTPLHEPGGHRFHVSTEGRHPGLRPILPRVSYRGTTRPRRSRAGSFSLPTLSETSRRRSKPRARGCEPRPKRSRGQHEPRAARGRFTQSQAACPSVRGEWYRPEAITSSPSVATIVPPPPMTPPISAPFTPPMMPPMMAPTAEPAPIRAASPLMPSSLLPQCTWRSRIG